MFISEFYIATLLEGHPLLDAAKRALAMAKNSGIPSRIRQAQAKLAEVEREISHSYKRRDAFAMA